MSEQNVPAPVVPPTDSGSGLVTWWRGRNIIERICRHILAILVWTYAVGQLVVFDFDGWLLAHLPSALHWIIIYKLLVILLLAALVLNFVPRRYFWSWTAYVLFYPGTRLLFLLVVIGYVLFKLQSWTALFAILNVVFTFFGSFKANLLIYVAALIGMVTAFAANSSGNLVSAAILLVIVIVVLVARRLVTIFRPSPIFNVYVVAMSWIMNYSRKNLIKASSLKGVDVEQYTLPELEKRYGQLSTAVLLSELCGFLEMKFKDYRSSGIAIATYLTALFGLLVLVILFLGFANFALYRADAAAFYVTGGHNIFDFIYYSFGAVTSSRIAEIVPASLGAKLVSMLATTLGFIFVAGTLLSLVLTVKRDQDDAGIERAIKRLREERSRMDQYVEHEFALPLDDAISLLERLKGGLVAAIQLLRAAQAG